MPIPPNKDHKVYDIIDFKPDEYAMIVLPGGVKSMEKLRLNDRLIKIIRDFDNNDKLIASICSAAQLLISADIIKDRKISAYYSMKQDVINAGAEFIDSPFVVDKNIISSPHYKYVNFWIKKAIEKYKEKNKCLKLHLFQSTTPYLKLRLGIFHQILGELKKNYSLKKGL